MPNSPATCVSGRPLERNSATASCLNSGVNSRRVLFIGHLPRSQGAYSGVSINSKEDQSAGVCDDLKRRSCTRRPYRDGYLEVSSSR
jgi:16S rRNA C1402 (ribose-2'-O) methylase RsmI